MHEVNYRDLDGEHLSRIVPAYFYITTRERNAWHSTTSRQYRGQTSLTCTFAGAKKVAEGWRAQGSAFAIQQVPGLHLMSEWADVAIVEFHTNDSYSAWDHSYAEALQPGSGLRDVLNALGAAGHWRAIPPSAHSFVTGVLDADEVAEPLGARAVFRAWSSLSLGSDYVLGWSEHPGRHKAPGVRRIAKLATTDSATDGTTVGR
ncbi:hypothetical protein [Microbacterium memoriense]|uniref:Uncharacterized protein n=1 Tax=Microbacterium memoriense TaxID=2978350 RepID=A0ABT2PGS9_9MICO|nr:hypothetical protein [Microbacterium memoriense]MCT9002963.1 hypothetical protein [Microbacterium memoriense]